MTIHLYGVCCKIRLAIKHHCRMFLSYFLLRSDIVYVMLGDTVLAENGRLTEVQSLTYFVISLVLYSPLLCHMHNNLKCHS